MTVKSTTSPLIDPYGRPIEYLRVSVTDRCVSAAFIAWLKT